MPWVVAGIAVISFAAGLATANGRWVLGGWLVSAATGVALVLRWYVFLLLHEAFERGVGYGESTRRRIRELPEATEVPEAWASHEEETP